MSGVVLVGPFPGPVLAEVAGDLELMSLLGSAGTVRLTEHRPGTPEFAVDLKEASVLLTASWIQPECWDEAPHLELVSIPATGYQTFVDVAGAHRRGIEVAYVPSYGAEAIAEHALAMLLGLAKNVVPSDASLRSGGWRVGPSVQLFGAVAGVIGLGPIGHRMVRMLEAFGMEVLVWTRMQDPARLEGTSARYAPLEHLVESADVISVHLALAPETTGLLDSELLGRAKQGAILVNTARAEVIAVGAAEELVRAGRLRVGTDVFRQEPPARDDPMLGLGHGVLLTPHNAFNTPQASRSVVLGAARNVAAFATGSATNLVPHIAP